MHSVFNGMSEHNMLLLDLTECTSMIACCHISTIFQVGCRVIYSLVLIQPTVYDRKRRLLKSHRQQGSHLCVLPVWQQHMWLHRARQASGRALVWHWHRAVSCVQHGQTYWLLHLGSSQRASTHIQGSWQCSACIE